MSRKKIDRLCDVMRGLHRNYNSLKDLNNYSVDQKIAMSAKIQLLENLLQEAAFIKKEKDYYPEIEMEDVGC
jgi:hypothetical protein